MLDVECAMPARCLDGMSRWLDKEPGAQGKELSPKDTDLGVCLLSFLPSFRFYLFIFGERVRT